MGPATLILVIFAVLIAFWAGSRWRHNRRTWADHKLTVGGVKSLRKLRWVTLKAALVALVATLLYLVGTGAISFASLDTKHQPVVTPSSSHPHKP
jgi:ABC-type dipeptide/oligopeptide/nickel transport system permease component